MRFIATCTFGLEAILRKEIKSLDLWYEEVGDGYVAFAGDESAMGKSNLWLRTANKVFLELASFPATSFEDLFEGVAALPWEQYISEHAMFPVLVKSYKSQLSSTPACQSIVKKAIVKKLQHTYHREEFLETEEKVEIHIWLRNDGVKVLLNTSGEGLHKRGYRESNLPAPLKETLAAGLVYISEWKGDAPLYDPFCGSGTILIEAAMLALNIAPGLMRSFAFEDWSWTDKELFENLRSDAITKKITKDVQIFGSDFDPDAIALAKQYATNAQVECIKFFEANVLHSQLLTLHPELHSAISTPHSAIISNPPYGIRLGDEEEVEQIYDQLGRYYREWAGVRWHVFSAYPDVERAFGSQAKRRKLYNGGIQCYLYSY